MSKEDRAVMHQVMKGWMAGTAAAMVPQVIYDMLVVLEKRRGDEFSIQEAGETVDTFIKEMREVQRQGVEALPLSRIAVWLVGQESSLPFTGVFWLMTFLQYKFRDQFSDEKALDSLPSFISWAEDIKNDLLSQGTTKTA